MELFYDIRNMMTFYVLIPLQVFGLIIALFFIFRWVRTTYKRKKGQARPAVRRKTLKQNCTHETIGYFSRVLPFKKSRVNIYSYSVDGKYYEIYDVIIYRMGKVYKLGPIPIGYEMKSKLPDLERVRIRYNPLNPQEAYLPDNEGKWTLS